MIRPGDRCTNQPHHPCFVSSPLTYDKPGLPHAREGASILLLHPSARYLACNEKRTHVGIAPLPPVRGGPDYRACGTSKGFMKVKTSLGGAGRDGIEPMCSRARPRCVNEAMGQLQPEYYDRLLVHICRAPDPTETVRRLRRARTWESSPRGWRAFSSRFFCLRRKLP